MLLPCGWRPFCLWLRCSSVVPQRRDGYASSSTPYPSQKSTATRPLPFMRWLGSVEKLVSDWSTAILAVGQAGILPAVAAENDRQDARRGELEACAPACSPAFQQSQMASNN